MCMLSIAYRLYSCSWTDISLCIHINTCDPGDPIFYNIVYTLKYIVAVVAAVTVIHW